MRDVEKKGTILKFKAHTKCLLLKREYVETRGTLYNIKYCALGGMLDEKDRKKTFPVCTPLSP